MTCVSRMILVLLCLQTATATSCDQLQCLNSNPCQPIVTRDRTAHAQCLCAGKWAGLRCELQLRLKMEAVTSSTVQLRVDLMTPQNQEIESLLTTEETLGLMTSFPPENLRLDYTLAFWRSEENMTSLSAMTSSPESAKLSCVLLHKQNSQQPALLGLLPSAFKFCKNQNNPSQQHCVPVIMGAKHSSKRGGSSASSPMDKKFLDDTVRAHNEYRKRHQAPPLSHNKELSAHAQRWADHLASTGAFQHSSATIRGEKVGENIAMKWSSAPDAYTGQEVTDQWYSEVKMHVFGTEPASLSSGHFTQVVWRGSKEVGVGRAVSRDGKVMVVANYRPPGNMMGAFAQNVLAPKDGKIVLPSQPASKAGPATTRTTTTHFNQRAGAGAGAAVGDVGGPFSRHLQDKRGDMFGAGGGGASSGGGARSESRSVRTYTVTEGVGANKVTKTVTEETIIKNGEKTVNRKETITSGGATTTAPSSMPTREFGRLALTDQHQQKQGDSKQTKKKSSKPFWKSKKRSSSSSSDSSPERNSSKKKTTSTPTPAAVKGVSSSSSSRPQKMSDFHKDCLQAHNSKRSLHRSPPLKLASDLSEHAQKWAEHLASTDSFQHSACLVGSNRVGENIACSWSSSGADYTGEQVVDQWYSEIQKHNFQSDGSAGSGHFTQVVWKGSKELGVGKAKTGKGKCIVVCNYRPAGNMRGDYRNNVLPAK